MLAAGLVASRTQKSVSAALVRSNGEAEYDLVHMLQIPFTVAVVDLIEESAKIASRMIEITEDQQVKEAMHVVTQLLYEGYRQLVRQSAVDPSEIETIGGYGCPLAISPNDFRHVQIGDFALVGREAGKPVCADFQRAVDGETLPANLDDAAIDGATLAYVAIRRMMLKPVLFPSADGGLVAMTEGHIFKPGESKWS